MAVAQRPCGVFVGQIYGRIDLKANDVEVQARKAFSPLACVTNEDRPNSEMYAQKNT